MDPNQALAEAVAHLCEGERSTAHERFMDLLDWLALKDGFRPEVGKVVEILRAMDGAR